MLRKIDGFLTLTRFAPGGVAIGDGDGDGLVPWSPRTGKMPLSRGISVPFAPNDTFLARRPYQR